MIVTCVWAEGVSENDFLFLKKQGRSELLLVIFNGYNRVMFAVRQLTYEQ